jgi:hypothetical protein
MITLVYLSNNLLKPIVLRSPCRPQAKSTLVHIESSFAVVLVTLLPLDLVPWTKTNLNTLRPLTLMPPLLDDLLMELVIPPSCSILMLLFTASVQCSSMTRAKDHNLSATSLKNSLKLSRTMNCS